MALRSRSLRTVLMAGMGAILVGGVATTIAVSERIVTAANEQETQLLRYAQVIERGHDHFIALLNQEVGFRAYIATGDPRFLQPYEMGHKDEVEARRQLDSLLNDDDRGALGAALAEVEQTTGTWRAEYVEPQLARRDGGPIDNLPAVLVDGKRRFDLIRGAHAKFHERANDLAQREGRRGSAAISRARLVGYGITGAMLVLGALAAAYVLRHTVKPLAELAAKAAAHQPFPAASTDVRVREVADLQQALHDLDRTARERERARAQGHARAVAFNAFGEFVQQLVDENELHQALARTLDDTLEPDKVQIMVRSAGRNRLDVSWPTTLSAEEAARHPILAEPQKCRAARTLRPVMADAGAATACACPLGVPETGSYCCVPMVAAGDLVGVVNMQSHEPGRFPKEVVEANQGYINFASTSLSSIRLLSATRERALRDSLTGAYNRAFLSEYLAKQLSLASRRSRSLAVLVCDLDHFKQVNDRFGHQVGDRALVAFASLLHSCVRTGDAVIRYGGEEFVVVLVETDIDGARIAAERIRATTEATIVSNGPETVGAILRTSIGLAAFPAHGHDETSLIAAADRAVYQAKREGRNRVVVASSPSVTGELRALKIVDK